MSAFPNIDPRVHCVGVSALRKMTARKLAEMDDELYLLQDADMPLAVLIPYGTYLCIQDLLREKGSNS